MGGSIEVNTRSTIFSQDFESNNVGMKKKELALIHSDS